MSVLDLIPRKLGSFEQYSISLSRALSTKGSRSVLVFSEPPPAAFLPLYLDAGASLETKPFVPFSHKSGLALRGLLQRHRPDVVHLHFTHILSFDTVAAGLAAGVKLVFSSHSSDVPKQRSMLKAFLSRAAVRAFSSAFDAYVVPSEYVRNRDVRAGVGASKITRIYNGVSLEKFRSCSDDTSVRSVYGVAPGSLLVVSISQVIPEKGVGYLIEAAARVRQRGADITFLHVGDGPYADEYKAKARELGLEGRFVFTGLLNMPQVASILRQADIFTLPCVWGEAFSLTILEALAAGRPAIVTNVGGNAEAVLDGRNGLLVPPHDAGALAAAILALHDDPERRLEMGRESLRLSEDFSAQRWVEETLKLYYRLTGARVTV
jgi:glycosyltransferase involved in cell wall biosynthesis